jgi:signal peptidase
MNTKHKQVIKMENEAFFTVVEQRLDVGDQVCIPVVGKSMEPFLRERDEVLLQTAKEVDIATGDIVLARWGQRYVLHRVVRKKKDELWLAGDNNLGQIEKIAYADLIAVLFEARRAGKLLAVSRTFNKSLGMLWYYLRLPRRVVAAIKRRL